MAGSVAGWDKAAFRDGILLAMGMAAPNVSAMRTTFRWIPVRTFARQDPASQPLNWGSAPTTNVETPDLEVPSAWQAGRFSDTETPVGSFDDSTITIVVLGTEWEQLMLHGGRRPDMALVGGKDYVIDYDNSPPLIALFDEDVHLLFAVRSKVQ